MVAGNPLVISIIAGLFVMALVIGVRSVIGYRRALRLVRWEDHPSHTTGGPAVVRLMMNALERRTRSELLRLDLHLLGMDVTQFASLVMQMSFTVLALLLTTIWFMVFMGIFHVGLAIVGSVIVVLGAFPLGLVVAESYLRSQAKAARVEAPLLIAPILSYLRLAMTAGAGTMENSMVEYMKVYGTYAHPRGRVWLNDWYSALAKRSLADVWTEWGRTYQVPVMVTLGAGLAQAQQTGAPLVPVLRSLIDQTWRQNTDMIDTKLRSRQNTATLLLLPYMIVFVATVIVGMFLGNQGLASAIHLLGG